MITDTGVNILDPGKTPAENTQFLIFLTAVIKAVDEYAAVLRISVASAGNDHRLGANEAPPAVVSVFLGDELTEVLKSIENGEYFAGSRAVQMDIGAKVLPHFVKDNTDRNRTSPFAFTGNKFEFRMLGSEASVANPNIILNTAVAECVHQFAEQLKDVPEDKMPEAVQGLRTMGARGWNITMPGKNIMCKLADKVSPASEISGACNTIVNDNGILTAYTTDGVGFMRAVAENGVDIIGKKMTLLGAGGAATAILVQAAMDLSLIHI